MASQGGLRFGEQCTLYIDSRNLSHATFTVTSEKVPGTPAHKDNEGTEDMRFCSHWVVADNSLIAHKKNHCNVATRRSVAIAITYPEVASRGIRSVWFEDNRESYQRVSYYPVGGPKMLVARQPPHSIRWLIALFVNCVNC